MYHKLYCTLLYTALLPRCETRPYRGAAILIELLKSRQCTYCMYSYMSVEALVSRGFHNQLTSRADQQASPNYGSDVHFSFRIEKTLSMPFLNFSNHIS